MENERTACAPRVRFPLKLHNHLANRCLRAKHATGDVEQGAPLGDRRIPVRNPSPLCAPPSPPLLGGGRSAGKAFCVHIHVADISQPYPSKHDNTKQQTSYAPEHKSTCSPTHYTYTNTLPPTWTLPAACTQLQTTFSIGSEPQKLWFQKKPKVPKHRVAVFRQVHVRTKGGGGGVHVQQCSAVPHS